MHTSDQSSKSGTASLVLSIPVWPPCSWWYWWSWSWSWSFPFQSDHHGGPGGGFDDEKADDRKWCSLLIGFPRASPKKGRLWWLCLLNKWRVSRIPLFGQPCHYFSLSCHQFPYLGNLVINSHWVAINCLFWATLPLLLIGLPSIAIISNWNAINCLIWAMLFHNRPVKTAMGSVIVNGGVRLSGGKSLVIPNL